MSGFDWDAAGNGHLSKGNHLIASQGMRPRSAYLLATPASAFIAAQPFDRFPIATERKGNGGKLFACWIIAPNMLP